MVIIDRSANYLKKILVLLLLCLPKSLKYNYYQATNNKNENISDSTSKFGVQDYK